MGAPSYYELMEKHNELLLALLKELRSQSKVNSQINKQLRSISMVTNISGLIYLLSIVIACVAGVMGAFGAFDGLGLSIP